jgi:predicted ABC-type ATPase
MATVTRGTMKRLIGLMPTYPENIGFDGLKKYKNPKLIIMVGGPASGKSTVRERCADQCDVDNAIILNPDYIIEREFDNDNSRRETVNAYFRNVYNYIMEHSQGINIIYDRTGAYVEHTQYIVDLIRRDTVYKTNLNYEIVLCISIVPVEIGLERALERETESGRNVPPHVIERIYDSIDNIREIYETNQELQLFSSLADARDNLVGSTSRSMYIDETGALVLPTLFKGNIYIPYGQYTANNIKNIKKGEFVTPRSRTHVINLAAEDRDEKKDISKDTPIQIKTENGETFSFFNTYRLFNKVIAYDNTGTKPELLYYYDNGKIIFDKQFRDIARETLESTNHRPANRYSILNTPTGRQTAYGGKKRKKQKTKKRKRKKKSERKRKHRTIRSKPSKKSKK